jgi:MSHA biogenesis protein MshP
MFLIHKNKGFALPSAIFLLVVLSLLAVALLAINSYSQKSSIADVLDTKAYLAAKLGSEYGSYQAIKNNSCSSTAQTVNITDSYFTGFKASYICETVSNDEAGVTQTYYKITAYGCNTSNTSCPDGTGKPSNEDYVEKSITMVVSKN